MTKKLWGNACWYLFHTLAFRLNDKHKKEIPNILKHFSNLCSNLPCPTCASHATYLMKTLNKENVNNRDALINMLLEFHNKVNKNIGKPLFTRKQHDEMYKNANLKKILKNFHNVMKLNLGQTRAMVYTLSRRRCIDSICKYVINNIHIFSH